MKTRNLRGDILRLFSNRGLFSLSMLFLLLFLGACSDDEDYGRKEFLIISETVDKEPTQDVYCKIEGGKDTLYIFSNVEYKYFFQSDNEDSEWVKIVSSDYLSDIGATRLILDIQPIGEDLLKRTGTMSFASSENYLGKFIPFNQGFATRLKEDFSWLKYGSDNPLETDKETGLEAWTETQTKNGWKTTISIDEASRCFGKNGYVKLGDESLGADLISPFTNGIINDTILYLSFDAVAFTSEDGVKDKNKLTVNIIGGGTFADGTSSVEIPLNYYDISDENLVETMWKDSRNRLFIVNGKDSPFTGDTRIQFITGESIESGGGNRVFIDNVNLFIVDENSYYLLDQQ